MRVKRYRNYQRGGRTGGGGRVRVYLARSFVVDPAVESEASNSAIFLRVQDAGSIASRGKSSASWRVTGRSAPGTVYLNVERSAGPRIILGRNSR